MSRRLRLDALIRVSQRGGREGESFRSPAQQRAICEQWAAVNDAEIVSWHESIDLSGKTMARRDIDAALGRLHSGETDGVITAFVSRLSRARIDEAFAVWDSIKAANGRLVMCDLGGIDIDTASGELVLTNLLGLARYQWRQSAERWDMSRRDAIKAGKAVGGAPFGYRFSDPTPRPNGPGVVDSRLVPDKTHAAIVPKLFERKAAGATWLELARWLDDVAPKSRGSSWARSSVGSIIKCRTYLGEVRHGKHVQPSAHEPLVSAAVWRRAQAEPGRRTPRGTYLLSGLARCAGCGRTMRGSSFRRASTRIYCCDGFDCPSHSTIIADRLDAEVIEQLFARLDDFHLQAVDGVEIERAREEARRLTGEVERLASVIPTHPAAVAAHQAALAEAEKALIDAEDRLQGRLASHDAPDARELRSDWPSLALDERREILRAGIDAVLVRRATGRGPASVIPKRILVLFDGEAPRDLADARGPVTSWAWGDDPGSLRAAA